MKIVVVDGYTMNPGDLSWDALRRLGECDVYEQSTPAENLTRCKDADIAVTNKVVFDAQTLDRLGRLKCIVVSATGYNVIDTKAAADKGIVVCNVPAYATESVAQMVFALLLELTQRVAHHAETVRQGRWATCENFCYWDFPLVELAGLTMGIVGFGHTGRAAARLARAFGMKVLVYDVFRPEPDDPEVALADLETVLAESDVVSLHCPLTSENEGMIDTARIATMKKTAFLINTARGPLVNERDLADALNADRIAGAGLDVLSVEPAGADNPLLTAKNCYITPHIAWATRSSRARLMRTAVDNISAFIEGKPRNVVT